MNTIEYYIELRFAFHTIADRIPFSVTTTEISEILHCTMRNARILLKKMHTEGYINWTSGIGRGNQSHLTFQLPLSSVIILHFQSLIQQNKIEEALHFLDRKEIPMDMKKKCYNQLRPHFGLQLPDISQPDEQKLPTIDKKMTLNHVVRHVHNRTSSWMVGRKLNKKTTFQWPTKDDL